MFTWQKVSITGLLTGTIFVGAYAAYLLGPAAPSGASRDVQIAQGSGVDEIAALLKTEHLIRSEAAFKLYSFFRGVAHRLKPGRYLFAPSLTTPEIVSSLVRGPVDVEIRIVEGKTVREIDDQLAAAGLITPGTLGAYNFDALRERFSFLAHADTLEGFLFPDTYRFSPNATPTDILKKLLGTFGYRASAALGITNDDGADAAWHQDLIIASLIEREVPFSEDRRIVAGILKKRLAAGMPLQVDATVLYAKCGGRFEGCPPLTKTDFALSSKYNTYRYTGLPPAPIANPGTDAMLAARNPVSSKYWYYLSDPVTKQTIFSETLAEHNKNRARYLR
jgi:UPF0755 protein